MLGVSIIIYFVKSFTNVIFYFTMRIEQNDNEWLLVQVESSNYKNIIFSIISYWVGKHLKVRKIQIGGPNYILLQWHSKIC